MFSVQDGTGFLEELAGFGAGTLADDRDVFFDRINILVRSVRIGSRKKTVNRLKVRGEPGPDHIGPKERRVQNQILG